MNSRITRQLESLLARKRAATAKHTFGVNDALLRAFYRKDPVAYVRTELGQNPSEDQCTFLMDLADLDNMDMIICAGRGAGKTLAVSWAVDWSISVLPEVFGKYDIMILGGSYDQSRIMYRYFNADIYKSKYLEGTLVGEPTMRATTFENGYVRALTASQKAVHGPHIELLIIDEVCDADDDIVEAAMPMVGGSQHGRTIMLSTPHKFWGVFQDYWDNAEKYKFRKYGPWPLTHCSWQDQAWIARMKVRLTPDKYKVDILGEFPEGGALVFAADWIDKCTAKKPFGINPNYVCDLGIDWGQVHPAVFTAAQFINGKIQVPGPEHVFEMMRYPMFSEKIVKFYRKNRGEKVFGDASHKSENERLEDAGLDVYDVYFVKEKQKMIEMMQWLLYKSMILISPDNETLIDQMKKYRWEISPSGKERPIKKNDDCVDSGMLSVFDLIDSRWYDNLKRADLPQSV